MTKLRIDAFQTKREIHFRLELSKDGHSYAADAVATKIEGSNEVLIDPGEEMTGLEVIILQDIANLMLNRK